VQGTLSWRSRCSSPLIISRQQVISRYCPHKRERGSWQVLVLGPREDPQTEKENSAIDTGYRDDNEYYGVNMRRELARDRSQQGGRNLGRNKRACGRKEPVVSRPLGLQSAIMDLLWKLCPPHNQNKTDARALAGSFKRDVGWGWWVYERHGAAADCKIMRMRVVDCSQPQLSFTPVTQTS
jgi:hypothetical protein